MRTAAVNARNFIIKEKTFTSAVFIFILVSFIAPYFLTLENLMNLSIQLAVYGIVALGMTFAIIGGEFDLSVGSILSLSCVFTVGLQPHIGLFAAIAAAVLSGIILGTINGFLVSRAGINSFIVTFGGMVFIKGIALTFSDGRPIISESEALNRFGSLNVLGIPVVFLIFVLLLVTCHFILSYSRFGRNVYAVGGNDEVASATGINVKFYKGSLFLLTGFFAAIVGVLLAARLNSGSPIQGDGMELTAIASVVIGGTSLSGGKGNVIRTLLGVFIIVLLTNAFDLIGIQPYIQRVIKGLIIISVVAFDSYNKKKLIV